MEDIALAIDRNQLDPHELEIEITEKFALSNDQRSLSTLEALHHCGVRIAIDDFGMGHSSLQYIKYFPVDTLKIDRSLSPDVLEDRSYQEIITSIVSLCSSLNIDVIVEYVETNKQRDLLKELGCLLYQGYLYSPRRCRPAKFPTSCAGIPTNPKRQLYNLPLLQKLLLIFFTPT